MNDMGKLAINGGEPVRRKSFTGWPIWDNTEKDALVRVLESGKWGCLNGSEVKSFESEYAAYHNVPAACAVSSGDAGLRIAYRASGIEPGDEVIVPAYTFISTAMAALELGAAIKFADVLPDTYNIDPASIEANITEKTRLIVPVHFAGLPAEMDEINRIAGKFDIPVVEDAAQAWGSSRNGKKAGNFSPFAVFSFQSSKNITSGEGGIITIRDEKDTEDIRSLANNGRRKDAKWYEHFGMAGNYRMTEFQGAVLRAQFARYPKQTEIREKRAAFLRDELARIEGITPLSRPPDVEVSSNHIFIFKYNGKFFGGASKTKFIEALSAEGIGALTGYVLPLYKQPALKGLIMDSQLELPVSEKACTEEAVWLRHSLLLDSEEDLSDICTAIKKIQENCEELN
jgi:dTDP-4-amino-4,6-dideoxygalactose transaminase